LGLQIYIWIGVALGWPSALVQVFVIVFAILARGFGLVTLFLILCTPVVNAVYSGLAGGFLFGAFFSETIEIDNFAHEIPTLEKCMDLE
jgi:hypothetical protein